MPDSLLSVCSINKLLLTLHTTYDVSYLINTTDIVVFMVCKGTPFIPTNKSVKKHNKIVTAKDYI